MRFGGAPTVIRHLVMLIVAPVLALTCWKCSCRYEKGAIILTTNRSLEEWGQLLGDTPAAGAILDRFLHHAEVVSLQGRSYRMHNRMELRSKQTSEALTEQSE